MSFICSVPILSYFTFIVKERYITQPNPHCAHVVGYGPFSLCVIHKEGLCPSSGNINRLMAMMRAIY
jgi:hypothetical protein